MEVLEARDKAIREFYSKEMIEEYARPAKKDSPVSRWPEQGECDSKGVAESRGGVLAHPDMFCNTASKQSVDSLLHSQRCQRLSRAIPGSERDSHTYIRRSFSVVQPCSR